MQFGKTSDFSPIAHRYDATRDIPRDILLRLYRRLAEQGVLSNGGRVMDVGCGTGQTSLPLAEMGCIVRGYDISPAMVAIAQGKREPGWHAEYSVADTRALPVASNTADAVVVSKLFMHIEDWQRACSECVRVIKPGGHFVHIRDRGWFGNAVRRRFMERADALGYPASDRFLGLTRLSDLEKHLTNQGCTAVSVDIADLRWEVRIRLGDVVDQFRERLFAEFWYMPAEIYDGILADAERFVAQQQAGPDTVETLSAYLAVEVFRKPL